MAYDPSTTAQAVHQALVTLGANLSVARRRRRFPMFLLAQRAFTTRQTISRMERGDPHVAIGTWAAVLFTLELGDRLPDLAAPTNDFRGRFLEAQQLPQRVRLQGVVRRRPNVPDTQR